jgi:hypothetical protein
MREAAESVIASANSALVTIIICGYIFRDGHRQAGCYPIRPERGKDPMLVTIYGHMTQYLQDGNLLRRS